MNLILLNIIIFLTVITGIGGDILAKIWASNKQVLLAVSAVALYALSGVFWLFWLKYERLSIAVTLWVALGEVFAVLVGIFVFHERLTIVEISIVATILLLAVVLNLVHA